MAVIDGFLQLLSNGGNAFEFIGFTGSQMKETRYKSAQFIFIQTIKDDYVGK